MSILLSITSSYNLVSILIMCALCSSERLITSPNFSYEPVSVLGPGYLGLSELLVIGLDGHVAVAAPGLGLRLEPGQNYIILRLRWCAMQLNVSFYLNFSGLDSFRPSWLKFCSPFENLEDERLYEDLCLCALMNCFFLLACSRWRSMESAS